MSNGSFTIPLSGSIGGAPIALDNAILPGTLVHANPADSGGNDVLQNILVGNPNANQVTLLVQQQGPGITTPRVIRIDVPPTAEGTDVRIFYTPFLLAPGFSYYIAAQLQPGNEAPYVYGYVERHATSAFSGYGGIVTTTTAAVAHITAGNWATVPFAATRPGVTKNVTTDPGNNRLALDVPGVWGIAAHITLEFTRDQINDRILNLRFWNEDKGVEAGSSPFPMYIEQGNTGVSWAVPPSLTDVAQDIVGDNLRVEIGGATESFAGIQVDKAGFFAYLWDPAL